MSFAFQNINVSIGNSLIIDEASAALIPGKITALIGPNGAGKSTLLTAIAGLRNFSGVVSENDLAMTSSQQREKTAYMPQDIAAQSSLTALEVVLLGRLNSLGLSIPDELVSEAEEALNKFGLAHLQERPLTAVSGGQRQLVYLTQALFRKPQLLLLDEPTASLDLRHQLLVLEAVKSLVRRDKISVVIAIHDISLAAQFADQIICICDGKVEICDEAEKVLKPDRLRRVFGVEVEVEKCTAGHLRVMPLSAAD